MYQHHKTILVQEPSWKEEKGKASELMETGPGSRHQEMGSDLESARKGAKERDSWRTLVGGSIIGGRTFHKLPYMYFVSSKPQTAFVFL